MREWLFVPICQPYDKLVTYPGCTPLFPSVSYVCSCEHVVSDNGWSYNLEYKKNAFEQEKTQLTMYLQASLAPVHYGCYIDV